ncbi:MAG: serine hydrolase [Bacteroidota bacterium]
MKVSPALSNVSVDDVFTVTIEIESNTAQTQQIDGGEVHLNFDTTFLEVQSLTAGSALPVQLIAPMFDNAEGTVDYAAGIFSGFPPAPIDLISIEFKAKAETQGTDLTYEFTVPARNTSVTFGGQVILNTTENGVVEIGPASNCPTTPASSSFNATIEQGQSFSFGGQTLTLAGTYTDSLTTPDGCDSLRILTLSVVPPAGQDVIDAIQQVLDDNIQPSGGLSASVLKQDGSIATVFNGIANIGQPFNENIYTALSDVSQNLLAVLVLKLAEDGLLNLSDQLGNGVLAGPPTFFPPTTTIQQLLDHNSGIKNFADNPNYKSNALSILFGDLTTDYSLINYTPILSTYVFPQGPPVSGTFLYSNTNYLTLGEKLEQLFPGQSLQDLLEIYVLNPASLTEIEFFKVGANIPPSNTAAYFFNLSGIAPEALVDQTSVLTSSGASGSIVATPRAIAAYMRALYGGQILNSTSLALLQNFTTINPAGRLGNAYALGTERFNLNIDGIFYDFSGHVGDLNHTSVYIYSDVLGTGAYVSANNDDVSDATILEIARLLIEAALNPDPCANVTPVNETVVGEICQGETFTFNGVTYSQSGSFQDTLFSSIGCDSVIVTVDVTVNPNVNTAISAAICDNETFAFGGQQLNVAGTYIDTLQTSAGCDSVVTLTLTVNPTSSETVDVQICQGESFDFGGQTYTASTTVTETFQSAAGCDSVVILNLTVVDNIQTTIDEAICDNESFTFSGQSLTVAGTYVDTLASAAGCDSIVTLNLTVNPTFNEIVDVAICEGESFEFGGQIYTASTTITETLPSAAGCDSVVTLNLTVNPVATATIEASICDDETFAFGGQQLNVAGTYTDTLQTSAGCDSVVTLTLTVNPTSSETVDLQICQGDSFDFGGQTYTASTTATETFQSAAGCDSVVTLNLTVVDNIQTTIDEAICDNESFTFGGQNLTLAGTYVDTLGSAVGCDSIVTLNLTVNATFNTQASTEICDGESFNFGSQTLTTAGTFTESFQTASGCDSIVTLSLTVNTPSSTNISAEICANETFDFGGQQLSVTGTYTEMLTNTVGCDSTVTLTLTVNPTFNETVTVQICQGDSFSFGGQIYTSSTTVTETFQTIAGCDSVVTLNLTVVDNIQTSITAEICDNETFTFGDQQLTVGGTYLDTLPSAAGCDSIVTLALIVNPTASTSISAEICDNETFTFGGQSLNVAGTYTETLQTSAGCDSVITLTLTVNPTFNETVNATINAGDSFDFGGISYTADTTVTQTFQSAAGCDSMVTLNLTVQNVFICTADAGTITADINPVTLLNGSATLSATPDGNAVVPTGYSVLYVLTSGANLVIEQTNTTPSFTVATAGDFTIHTLVYNADANDPNFLDLSLIIPGITTGGDVLGIVTSNSLCADLDVAGAPITVNAPTAGISAPTNLVVDNSTAFIAPLTWTDNSNNEDGFRIIRDGQVIRTVGPNVTTFTDTLFIFGRQIVYEVEAFNSTDAPIRSNQDTYAMPAQFIDLQLSFVCYDATTDSITWEVTNQNNQRHPYIYAQWWTPQRDTLFAIPGNSRFRTQNNPQNASTFGDDNITGIWFIDERLLPGEPNSIVFNIPLHISCGGLRQGPAVMSPKAGQFYTGKLARVINFGQSFWAQAVDIVPNPVNDLLTLDIKGVDAPVAVRVFDMAGKQMFFETVDLTQEVQLNLDFLAQGVYTLELQTESAFYTQKIIKQ